MPDVTIRNDTPDNLNVAFRFVAPVKWKNTLVKGESWTTNLASVGYTIEVRLDRESNRFSAGKSWATAGDITGGWLASAAGVGLGTLRPALGGTIGRVARPAIEAGTIFLMNHAIEAGGRFAQNADGMVITIVGFWNPLHNKTYAIRFEESSGYTLCDVDRDIKL